MSETKTTVSIPLSPVEPVKLVRLHNGNGTNGTEALGKAHPWARFFGSMKDDPTWDRYREIIEENRRAVNALYADEDEAAESKAK